MIKNIVNNIIKNKDEYVNDLTNLKKKQPAAPSSHRRDVDGFPGKRVQMDLLYLPDDRGYKYLLVAVDNYDGKTDAEPLKNRDARTIRNAIDKILRRKIIQKPYIIQVDNGSEFKKGLKGYLAKKNISLRVGATARHSQQAVVEARNKTFGTVIMKVQLANELENDETDREWVKLLPTIIKEINKVAKPVPVKRTGKVQCVKDDCMLYSVGDKVYYQLDFPINFEKKRQYGTFRAGDIRYGLRPKKIVNILLIPDRPPRYVLEGIDNRTFSKNQLKPEYFMVEKILGEEGDRYVIKWVGYKDTTLEPKKVIQEDVPDIVKQYNMEKKKQPQRRRRSARLQQQQPLRRSARLRNKQ